ncbi:MAG: ATP-binding protein [Gammaproteobacteria bacterium]|nr:ATP-binding protein [Gammaproteobacteria bacterium]
MIQSLKFQIVLAIVVLTALFAGATLYSLHVIDRQHGDDVLVTLASQMQTNQKHLTLQAMRYLENAPRDYASYNRDLGLYFEDLKTTRAELSRLIEAFAANRFAPELIGEDMNLQPQLGMQTQEVAQQCAVTWRQFLDGLDERIGPDQAEPRLEWAAEWIVQHHQALETISGELFTTLRDDVARRAGRANTINRVLLVAALVVSLITAAWFYRRVLAPLTVAVNGFKQVANGDFSYRVPVTSSNEIGMLAGSFNHLSDRLDALRKLLTGLEQGADLDGTLKTLTKTLPSLIPVDWIGVLVTGVDGRFHLAKAYSDGKPDRVGTLSFHPDRTLLDECIRSSDPLHIPDVAGVATLSDSYVFLNQLSKFGRRDAVFMPIGNGAVQGVAVFASRFPNNFRPEHLALLRNLGVLLGVSLGRTIQLTESSRLASIGQFASGIVHEIRNPLATIALALDHLDSVDGIPEGSSKRVALASTEVARLERLLEDILLYAKPLALDRQVAAIDDVVRSVVDSESSDQDRIDIVLSAGVNLSIDADRMQQVLLNLLRNARQAAPAGTPIRIRSYVTDDDWVAITLANQGEPIPPKTLERIFEPFVTTKRHGTGLGLPIVRRIIDAHGGQVTLASDALSGTVATLRLPIGLPLAADGAVAPPPAQAADSEAG